jgi:GNAT superfamily N-acetyltransferase
MYTHFLGKEEVDAYLAEFVRRLVELGDRGPDVWCPIGISGTRLAERLGDLAIGMAEGIRVVEASFDRNRKDNEVTFDSGTPASDLADKRVLVLDSAVHGGTTMQKVVGEVRRCGASEISTYGLVVKAGSRFIPSYWAVMIDDSDRAYFLLDEIPNCRLSTRNPYFHLRKLQSSDLNLPPVNSGLASIDRITWNDRYFDMVSSKGAKRTYLLEVGTTVAGYLTIGISDSGNVTVYEVAVDGAHAGKDLGGALMRWAETVARSSRSGEMDLWAIEKHVGFYEKYGYKEIQDQKVALSDGETYHRMNKALLSHL